MKHYVLVVAGCVESELVGPFKTDKVRDEVARGLRSEDEDGNDYVGWLDVDSKGQVKVGSYSRRDAQQGAIAPSIRVPDESWKARA